MEDEHLCGLGRANLASIFSQQYEHRPSSIGESRVTSVKDRSSTSPPPPPFSSCLLFFRSRPFDGDSIFTSTLASVECISSSGVIVSCSASLIMSLLALIVVTFAVGKVRMKSPYKENMSHVTNLSMNVIAFLIWRTKTHNSMSYVSMDTPNNASAPKCQCGQKARLCTNANPSFQFDPKFITGSYWECFVKKCNYFRWAEDAVGKPEKSIGK